MIHQSNLGKGSALKTGFAYVIKNIPEAEGCVTADSDGQHSINCIKKIVEALETNSQNLILGVRDFDKSIVPVKSYMGNILTQRIFKYLEGSNIKDTQTGLRGIPNNFMKECLLLSGKRFEFEMQMLILAIEKVKITQVPIKTIYDSRFRHSTHFKALKDSLSIYKVLGKKFFAYIFSSFSSFLVDILLFTLFLRIFADFSEKYMIILATICSRAFSLCYNYMCNYIFVFKSDARIFKSIIQYLILAAVQMIFSFSLVISVKMLFTMGNIVGIKVVVDVFLFIISYLIQQRYIFKKE